MRLLLPLLVTAYLLPLALFAQNVVVRAAQQPMANLPIRIEIKQRQGNFILEDAMAQKSYPLQWEDEQHAWFVFADSLPTGGQRNLILKKSLPADKPVTLHRNEQGVMVKYLDKNVFFYQSATAMPPPDSPAYYRASGYIHPLFSPAGKIMTEDFPSTHAHHHAIFHAWANTRFRNSHVDFWNQQKKEGTVKHNGIMHMKEGPVYAELVTGQEYLSLAHGRVLTETWTIRCFAVAGQYMFDIALEQENITEDTLYLDIYLYGGMAFRGAKQWDPHDTLAFRSRWNVYTSEGAMDSVANHTRARWVTTSGQIDGTPASVTIFNHPTNVRYPQKIRVHPDMPYWVYSPVVDQPLLIPPKGKYTARYRYYVCNSKPEETTLEQIQEAFKNN